MPDPYLTAATVRERCPNRLNNVADAVLVRWVSIFEDRAEKYLGTAHRVRTATYTGYASDGWLELPHRNVSSVTVVDEDNASVTVERTDAARGRVLVRVYLAGPLTASYSHGYATPDETLLQACAMFVERSCVADKTGQTRDALKFNPETGTVQYSTANEAQGRPTGFYDVDALLNSMRDERPMVY